MRCKFFYVSDLLFYNVVQLMYMCKQALLFFIVAHVCCSKFTQRMPERRYFLIQSFYLLCLCFVVNYRFLVGMFLCEKDSFLDKLFLLLFQLFRQIINHLYEISTLLTLSEDVILHSFVKLLGF